MDTIAPLATPGSITDPSFLEGAEPREPFCPSFVTLTHDTFQHLEGRRQNARPCAKSAWSGSRSGRKKISKAHLRSLAAACHLPLVGKAHETAKFRGFPHKGKARDPKGQSTVPSVHEAKTGRIFPLLQKKSGKTGHAFPHPRFAGRCHLSGRRSPGQLHVRRLFAKSSRGQIFPRERRTFR